MTTRDELIRAGAAAVIANDSPHTTLWDDVEAVVDAILPLLGPVPFKSPGPVSPPCHAWANSGSHEHCFGPRCNQSGDPS